ncbi:methylmalonyl-CoA mutase [Fibrisoma montanum]|uniref:Fused isobutyryl-CoA mutase n=1 Tax=Fibrisoma montanum TaxID=2305895 RepID=A0A418MEL1_9BACT|nr:methylmalonyl-CoA mutase family protein [Fibrisoma montanum]RIV25250.1 methylmalonyl-CoA mutase [Fibrisoma montanum]
MTIQETKPYQPVHKIRLVTAASLFDGHDAAINLMRRIMQSSGAEVIHLGHNRSVAEIVDCAIQEDVQGIAVTSYQGGHVEFFKYMYDLLQERGAGHIRIFGGGGGTILPTEIEELHAYGITRIYSPDDGRALGLQGMINDLLRQCDFPTKLWDLNGQLKKLPETKDINLIARLITTAENEPEQYRPLVRMSNLGQTDPRFQIPNSVPVLGITGTGGAGKSSLVDELVLRYLRQFPDKTLAIISVDPSKRKTGGALLGDRIRMNAINDSRVYMRSLATRQSNLALSKHVQDAIDVCKAAHFDLIIVETSGIGQSDTEITEHSNVSLYVMTAEYGAATQLEKIDMLDFADVIAINKFDKRGSLDALRDVRKQYRRNHNLWDTADDDLPIVGTIASQFNDAGMNRLFDMLMQRVGFTSTEQGAGNEGDLQDSAPQALRPSPQAIIPADRVRYLAEIVEESRRYDEFVNEQTALARQLYQIDGTLKVLTSADKQTSPLSAELQQLYTDLESRLHSDCRALLKAWPEMQTRYTAEFYEYKVRDKVIRQPLYTETLSHLKVPKVSLPKYNDWGDILRWLLTENVPGEFPYAAGVFPLKRDGEDPTRMFAGEGGPERTNRRFHYVSKNMPAKRLSTAFDSVTLYGEDPDYRPDIYGKVGNSGVSICTLDDAKKLYSGFNLCDPATSVSMTINGPAPMLLGFFLNAAIDQQCELWLREQGSFAQGLPGADAQGDSHPATPAIPATPAPRYQGPLPEGNDGLGLLLIGTTGDKVLPRDVYEKIKADTLRKVRGTVQADILKEDQAQNTCIFSTEFALKMMGDIQAYFTENRVQNFYSVSISGYHIAEAGANPISQLAFTLANGFTFVEYYLSRGLNVDDFAPNLSFFFSNGMDPEYTVLGRVARRIWAKAMKYKYRANDRSQKLKYHIQTSGRSLHAQEIAFNDIRTTLQALLAIYDNCNSLHTNAYDEAITTPTEESVRRAMAIQLIINREFGLTKNENPLQGAFIVDELTGLVEEAVYQEFLAINERGGVLGAMERMYQRSKIQEESMYYETLKHNGQLPIIGVNTFLDPKGSPTVVPAEVIRSTDDEKRYAVESCRAFQERHRTEAEVALQNLQNTALAHGNLFESLMEATKVCSLGQLSRALYAVGGQYRRNM